MVSDSQTSVFHILENFWVDLEMWKLTFLISPEAPAARLQAFGRQARKEFHEHGKTEAPHNASKTAHSFVNRWNLTWKVPFSEFKHLDYQHEEVVVSYISPKSFIRFLLKNAPELLMAGVVGIDSGQSQLEAFWSQYKRYHPTHCLFQQNHQYRSYRNTIPICLHGDEGRGKKKATRQSSCWRLAWVLEPLRTSATSGHLTNVRSVASGPPAPNVSKVLKERCNLPGRP